MKKCFVAILVLIIVATVALFGCEKKQAAPPPVQSAVTPTPAPTPVPAPAPAPNPAPVQPAKK